MNRKKNVFHNNFLKMENLHFISNTIPTNFFKELTKYKNDYCGAKGSGNPDPFHIKPKAHAEEEEMSEDERRRSELPGDVAEDNFVLSKLRSWKEKVARHQG